MQRKGKKMPMKNNREYRNFEVRAFIEHRVEEGTEDRQLVKGYASTFNNEYVLYDDGEYEIREKIDAHAFDDTDMSDTIMQYDHQGRVFARVSNGTLSLNIDEVGLEIEGNLGMTDIGRQLYQEIEGGYTTKMSVGMTVDRTRDVWTRKERAGKTIEIRTINRVKKLYDVSAVSLPANDATSISVRALTDGVIEKLKAERLEAEKLELEKQKVELRAKAIIAGRKK